MCTEVCPAVEQCPELNVITIIAAQMPPSMHDSYIDAAGLVTGEAGCAEETHLATGNAPICAVDTARGRADCGAGSRWLGWRGL